MARMLGYHERAWCPFHRNKGFGRDCPDAACGKRVAKAREKRAWRREAEVEVRLRQAFARGFGNIRLF